MRTGAIPPLFLFLATLILVPAGAQDEGIETWDIPGEGAGRLFVSPADGSLWTFCHQSSNLVALDTSDGSVMLDIPLTMRPTSMAFMPDGSMIFLVGEPLGDQIIDRGLIQCINPSDGHVVAGTEAEGACNAVYVSPDEAIYVASGMQYAYEGTVYRLSMVTDEEGGMSIEIAAQAACGKIPWAIALSGDYLYVTDLELQWTAQPDGSMGPPYGSWVWAYDADTLEFVDKSWVGINPSRLVVTDAGVLAACSGSKQGEGALMEPAITLIEEPGAFEPIYIGTTGASDIAVVPDTGTVVATLADWGPPAEGSAMAMFQQAMPGRFSEARRWIYTGDLALIELGEDQAVTERIEILEDSFLRAIAISLDGSRVYALQGDPERIIVIPTGLLKSGETGPLLSE